MAATTTNYKNLPVLREAGDLNSDVIAAAEADLPSVTFKQDTATVAVNGTVKLEVTTNPRNAKVTYTSGTPANATVDANTGVVTGVATGSSVITAKITHGETEKTDTCTVTIS